MGPLPLPLPSKPLLCTTYPLPLSPCPCTPLPLHAHAQAARPTRLQRLNMCGHSGCFCLSVKLYCCVAVLLWGLVAVGVGCCWMVYYRGGLPGMVPYSLILRMVLKVPICNTFVVGNKFAHLGCIRWPLWCANLTAVCTELLSRPTAVLAVLLSRRRSSLLSFLVRSICVSGWRAAVCHRCQYFNCGGRRYAIRVGKR